MILTFSLQYHHAFTDSLFAFSSCLHCYFVFTVLTSSFFFPSSSCVHSYLFSHLSCLHCRFCVAILFSSSALHSYFVFTVILFTLPSARRHLALVILSTYGTLSRSHSVRPSSAASSWSCPSGRRWFSWASAWSWRDPRSPHPGFRVRPAGCRGRGAEEPSC